MIRSKSVAAACLAVLIATAGCSSGGGSSDSAFNQQDFSAVMSYLLIPVLRLLNPFQADGCPGDLTSAYCSTSGQASCAANSGGTTLTFTNCISQGAEIDGNWVTVGTPDNNTSTLDVVISFPPLLSATLSGDLATSPGPAGNCSGEVRTVEIQSISLLVDAAQTSIVIDGSLAYCSTSDWPSGSRNLTIIYAAHDFLYEMTLDGTNQALTTVKDQSSGNTLATCVTNLDTGVSHCP